MDRRPKTLRPCGALERYSTSRHLLGVYRAVGNTCQYAVPAAAVGDGALRAAFEHALVQVILKFPNLRAGIAGEETTHPEFVHLPCISMQDVLEWREIDEGDPPAYDDRLLRIIEARHGELWPDLAHKPGWQVIAVQNKALKGDVVTLDVMFAVHHAVCDGGSTSIFHRSLLEALNQPTAPPPELRGRVLHLPAPEAPTPSQDELVAFRYSWRFFLGVMWDEFAPSWLRGPPAAPAWKGSLVKLEPHGVNLRLVALPDAAVRRLVAACRARSATLTSLLHALLLASLARRLPADAAPSFATKTAISLRPHARAGPRFGPHASMANLVTTLDHAFAPDVVAALRAAEEPDAVVWAQAAAHRRCMGQRLATLPWDDSTGLAGWVGDWNARMRGRIGKERDASWEVSNLGSMAGGGAGGAGGADSWKIRRSIFSQSAPVCQVVFALNVAGIQGENLCMTINWQESVVDAEVMEGVVADLKDMIARFVRDGKFLGRE